MSPVMTNTKDTPPTGATARRPRKAAAKKAGAARRSSTTTTAAASPADPPAGEPEPTPPPSTRGPGRPSNTTKRADRYTQRLDEVGEFVEAFEAVDGAIIRRGAPRLGTALAQLAEQNPGVARMLDGAALGGAYTQVGLASLAIILPIVMHHITPAPPVEPAAASPWPNGMPNFRQSSAGHSPDDLVGAFVAEPTVDRSDPAPPPPSDPARLTDPQRPWMQAFTAQT